MISDLAQIGLAGIGIVVIAIVAWIGGLILFWTLVGVFAAIRGMTLETIEVCQKRHDQISGAWFRWLDSRWP